MSCSSTIIHIGNSLTFHHLANEHMLFNLFSINNIKNDGLTNEYKNIIMSCSLWRLDVY